jgi:hypothetical protein
MAQQPQWVKASLSRVHDHTQTKHTTIGRTLLGEWPEFYMTTYNTHNRQTSMHPAGFEPAFPASEQPQAHAVDRAATGIGRTYFTGTKFYSSHVINSQTCCGTLHLPYNGSFESVVITTTKTPWWWHLWCADTCRRIVNVGRIHLVHV